MEWKTHRNSCAISRMVQFPITLSYLLYAFLSLVVAKLSDLKNSLVFWGTLYNPDFKVTILFNVI